MIAVVAWVPAETAIARSFVPLVFLIAVGLILVAGTKWWMDSWDRRHGYVVPDDDEFLDRRP